VTEEFDIAAFKNSLKTKVIGQQILYYPSLPSTMDTALEKTRQGAEEGMVPEGTVIIAGEQTKGRGRLKRNWLSPKGNIALSIILRPDITSMPYLIMIASLAAAGSIESVTGQKTQIKWPNDILIMGKKVCGILIENEVKGNKLDFSVIGIGINTDLDVSVHDEIADTAISLKSPANNDLRLKLISTLLTRFEELYLTLPDGKPIFNDWRDRLVTLGKKVKATWGTEVIEGVAEDVDETGTLTIRGADGTLTKVVAGDVTLRG
jgi:BirA family transcriptional regulator, biotin operon repressor / biotin---[acetyl-CoA-carboxylase] ligase